MNSFWIKSYFSAFSIFCWVPDYFYLTLIRPWLILYRKQYSSCVQLRKYFGGFLQQLDWQVSIWEIVYVSYLVNLCGEKIKGKNKKSSGKNNLIRARVWRNSKYVDPSEISLTIIIVTFGKFITSVLHTNVISPPWSDITFSPACRYTGISNSHCRQGVRVLLALINFLYVGSWRSPTPRDGLFRQKVIQTKNL